MSKRKETASGLLTHTPTLWTPPAGFTLLATIEVGGFASGLAVFEALEKKGRKVSDNAKSVLSHPSFPLLREPQEWEFYKGPFGALNLEEYPCEWNDVRVRAAELGFHNLPPMAAGNLRLSYQEPQNQFTGYLLSKLMPGPLRAPHALGLKRVAGELCLDAYWVDPGYRWTRGFEGLVGRRKSPLSP